LLRPISGRQENKRSEFHLGRDEQNDRKLSENSIINYFVLKFQALVNGT